MDHEEKVREAVKKADSLPTMGDDVLKKLDGAYCTHGYKGLKQFGIDISEDVLALFSTCVTSHVEAHCNKPGVYGWPRIPVRKYLRAEERRGDGRGEYGYVCMEAPTLEWLEEHDSC
jgi:hypothetical protein